ncbi:hypothetical protein ACFQXB_04785 [Plastorhodobacter daqingensis]|uniref:Divergent polysaccharide deacetylase family protein n=1 Tax=Plastorhodobacter daqingensis TaxID=1387281 RepID=A0ABW2UJX4_9RHOB
MGRGFLLGMVSGLAVSAAALATLSLLLPLPAPVPRMAGPDILPAPPPPAAAPEAPLVTGRIGMAEVTAPAPMIAHPADPPEPRPAPPPVPGAGGLPPADPPPDLAALAEGGMVTVAAGDEDRPPAAAEGAVTDLAALAARGGMAADDGTDDDAAPARVQEEPARAPVSGDLDTAPGRPQPATPQRAPDLSQPDPLAPVAAPTPPVVSVTTPEPSDPAEATDEPAIMVPDAAQQASDPAADPAPGAPDAEAMAAAAPLPEDAATPPSPDAPALSPLERHAAPFEGAAGRPLFAIVLLDSRARSEDRVALTALGLPLTVAVDPGQADLPARISAYRASGIEVMVLGPGDAELLDASGAIGLLDLPRQSGAQSLRLNRDPAGFGTVSADPEAEGAPVELRLLVPDASGAEGLRRSLDRAAFRAAQDGAMVVLGEATAPTLAALADWVRSGGRAESVALAPVSAVLRLRATRPE